MEKPLICLACIVGNEEAVIERFIRSFEPAIDHIVFIKAIGHQPSDKTEEVAKKLCAELGLSCEFTIYVNERLWPHVDDFSAARNLAWEVGEHTGAKYLIWADADDLLSEGSAEILIEAAESGKSDVYIVPYEVRGKAQIVYRERMVCNDGSSSWHYPVHELLQFKRAVCYKVLKDCSIIHAPLADKKYGTGRNRRILEHATADMARHLFFLSLESLETGNIELFRTNAVASMANPSLEPTESYELLTLLAQHESDGIRGQERARNYAAQAFALMPDRREALALLACYALIDERKEEAFAFAKLMASIPIPCKAYWTLNREWYTWKGFYLLTQTMRAVGKEEDALKMEKEQFDQNGAIFSICHPTYKRPEQALAIRDIYLSRATNPMAIEYIFGIHHDDEKSLKLLSGYRHTITDKEGCCPNTHEAFKASTGKFIMVIADDLFPPMGWDEQISKVIDLDKPQVLNFADCLRSEGKGGEHLCHAFMTRPWLDTLLADPWPGTGIFSDNEFTHRSQKAGIIVNTPTIIFQHRHPLNGTAPMDATYEDQNQPKNYEEGYKILIERNPDYPEPAKRTSLSDKIESLIARKGEALRFLQIGAHDGRTLDPLHPFIEKYPWTGIFVEPQPKIFAKLKSTYENRKGLSFENVAICHQEGPVKIFAFKHDPFLPEHATMLASFDKNALLHNGHGYKGEIEDIYVTGITLASLFKAHSIQDLDVLQIDTEGHDYEILKMLRETEIRPEIIHYEHAMLPHSDKIECEKMLANMGYSVTNLGIDTMACLIAI